MRYAGILGAVLLAMAVVAMFPAAGGYNAAAEEASTGLLREMTTVPEVGAGFSDIHKGYLDPVRKQATCGGYEAQSGARMYYFGFRSLNDYCDTKGMLANGFNEAWTCARNYCTNCTTIEDITDRYTAKDNVFASGLKTRYCPSR